LTTRRGVARIFQPVKASSRPRVTTGEIVQREGVFLEVDGRRLDPARYRIVAVGEIDISSTQELMEECEQALRLPIAALELDLSGVTFLDSTGIRCLVDCRRRCSILGVRLEVDAGRAADRALTLVGLGFPSIGSRRSANGS
jgi:anti-sigma B factor antagonist